MLRYLAGVGSALLLVAAGVFLWKSFARADRPIGDPPAARSQPLMLAAASPADPPAADRSREEKRFDRYDKDRDNSMTREEYLAPRRKAWAKLDTNGDGRLSFEEWAARTTAKFASADADKSATLSRAEFATTRVVRKSTPRCACPEARSSEGSDD